MQPPGPPRPFRGAQFDKDMFTFLPAHNKDVLADSSRKRKLNSSDHHINITAPNVRLGVSGTLQGKEIRSSPVSGQRESLKGYSDQRQYWDQNDNASKRWHHNDRGFSESRSQYTGCNSLSGQLQSLKHKVSSPFPLPEGRALKSLNSLPPVTEDLSLCENHESNAHVTNHNSLDWQPPTSKHDIRKSNAIVVSRNASNWPPSMAKDFFQYGNIELNSYAATLKAPHGPLPETQDLNRRENCKSDAHVASVANGPHFQEFWSFAHQKPVELRALASDICEQASQSLGEPQILPQTASKSGPLVGGLAEKVGHEEVTYKVDHPFNVKEYGHVDGVTRFENAETYIGGSASNVERSDTEGSAGFDSSKAPGNNVSTSVYNLQNETNNLLNVLKLLVASGIKLGDKKDENVQGSGFDDKMMKSPPGSIMQNHPPAHTNLSKSHEDGLTLNKPAANGEIVNECKSKNGVSAFAEKLWDGTLQLSTSVSVSVIAFFKSGDKMQDFSWSNSVEVRGKVRLEAFEKYVQDLPRSRSRGLMVMSLCWKEGSSDAGHKGMKEVARKYKEGKRVGVAKLSADVDLYICPHSDAIITILAKHGFFKGMTAIKEKPELLLGCVVWKKNSSAAPATMAEEGHTSTAVATSEKGQVLNESMQNSRIENSTEVLPSPRIDHAKHSMVIQHNLNLVSGASTQLSEFKTDVELHKPTVPIPLVSSKKSTVFSDDDDLPEYDFRAAVSQASLSSISAVVAPISAELKSESSTVSVTVPDNHLQQRAGQYSETQKPSFLTQEQNQIGNIQGPAPQNMGQQYTEIQGLVPQNVKQYSEVNHPCFPTQEQNQTGRFQGLVSQNMGQQSEVQPSNLPIQEKKPIEKSAACSKIRNLFVDDMPEWCPTVSLKKRDEATTKTGASVSYSNSEVALSGFANLTSECRLPLPPPPPPPPLTQMLPSSASHLPKPAVNDFMLENPAATSSQMQLKERDSFSAPHVPPPPPVGNSATNTIVHPSPANPSTQIQFGDTNPAAISSQMQFNEREYCSSPYAPLPPSVGNPATNNIMHCNPAASTTQMQFGDTYPTSRSSQMHFKERGYHSVPRVPPPPPVGKPSTNNLMHHSPAALQSQMKIGDTNSAGILSQMQFNKREYHLPHVPLPPSVGNPATNNLMHHSPAAPPTQMQFRDKNLAAISSQIQFNERQYHSAPHVPPPPVNNTAANNFVHHIPAARSTQLQIGDSSYCTAPCPSTPYIDEPTDDGAIHQNPAFPPGFAPNTAYKPYFDQAGTKSLIRPFRNTRP